MFKEAKAFNQTLGTWDVSNGQDFVSGIKDLDIILCSREYLLVVNCDLDNIIIFLTIIIFPFSLS